MAASYRHTQGGGVTLVALGAMLIVTLLLATTPEGRSIALAVAAILAVCLLLFYGLTIEIDEEAVVARFGLGLIRKRFPLARIQGVRTVRNKWWYGFGIRLTPHGWMFNISGLDAVELELEGGKKWRLGTDQPAELRDAIRRGVEG